MTQVLNRYTTHINGQLRSVVDFICDGCGKTHTKRSDALHKFIKDKSFCRPCAISYNAKRTREKNDIERVCSANFYGKLKKRRRSELGFNLTKEEVYNLNKSNCHYCDRPPQNTQIYTQRKGLIYEFRYNGIDRIKSDAGYVKENVVSCCRDCNRAKSDLSYEDFLNLVKLIAKKHRYELP